MQIFLINSIVVAQCPKGLESTGVSGVDSAAHARCYRKPRCLLDDLLAAELN